MSLLTVTAITSAKSPESKVGPVARISCAFSEVCNQTGFVPAYHRKAHRGIMKCTQE